MTGEGGKTVDGEQQGSFKSVSQSRVGEGKWEALLGQEEVCV